MRALGLLLSAVGLLSAAPAGAAYVITISQSGSDVVATGSGSLVTQGLVASGSGTLIGQTTTGLALIGVGSGAYTAYQYCTGPSSFGSGNGGTVATSWNGQAVGINGSGCFIYVPTGYISGTDLGISTAMFAGSTLASLGLNPGTYSYSISPTSGGRSLDTFTVNILGVPEPATWATMLLGFAAIGGSMRFRRRRASSFSDAWYS
jgi:hypothetical protein